jgi:polar amino acid transport system substrate-binding protein
MRAAISSACALLLAGCAAVPAVPMSAAAEAREILAPSGRLRVGLYLGGPSSALKNPDGSLRGVGHDLGRHLARELRTPFEPVFFERPAEVFEAAKAGHVDAIFTNASAERMKALDFSQPFLRIGLGYLARPGFGLGSADAVDQPGVRVVLLAGGTSDGVLSKRLKQAQIVRAKNVADGVRLLRNAEGDVLATQKATLFEMADQLPGSRVLEGDWGVENHSIGIPKGRERALPFLRDFVDDAVKRGLVGDAVKRAGLRGSL